MRVDAACVDNPSPANGNGLGPGAIRPMKTSFCTLAALLVLVPLGAPSQARAGINVWTTHGPYEQFIHALLIDPSAPNTIYAATYRGGVFKSIDRGDSWSPINTGMKSRFVYALVMDPT